MHCSAQHIAIIMDGNGRWAQQRHHARTYGHIRGARRVQEITRECARLGVKALTLYTFSSENWQRPRLEVNFLMHLLQRYLQREYNEILGNNIRFRTMGCLENIPAPIRQSIERMKHDSRHNTGMILNLALSYGARQEIADSIQRMISDVESGKLARKDIQELTLQNYLYTHDLPDPDLLIRTGGDQRISNFLLWQIAYAELYFTTCPWPEFGVAELHQALEVFATRERRFGLTSAQIAERVSL